MNKAIGILNLHDSNNLGLLNTTRSVASTSFLGRYAFMDFMLSNFSDSGIDEMAVLIKEHTRSIIQHVARGGEWTKNSKLGGLTFLYDEPNASNTGYSTDINNLKENTWFLKQNKGDVVVLAPADIIYRIDFRPLIEDHVKNNHRISVIVQKINNGKEAFIQEDIAHVDTNGFLRDLYPNRGEEDKITVSLRTYIIDKEVLYGLLRYATKTSSFFSLRDTIRKLAKDMPIYTYEHEGYVRCFDSLSHYLEYSLELLDRNVFNQLFDKDWSLYTKTYDTPPAKYLEHAEVKNSFIANGSIINGKVEHSIIGRDVVIDEGVEVKNSVIFSGTHISHGCKIDGLVCDKDAEIVNSAEIIGSIKDPQFIKRGDIV